MRARGVRVMLCEANDKVKGKLVNAGQLAPVDPLNYCDAFGAVLAQCGTGPDVTEATSRAHA